MAEHIRRLRIKELPLQLQRLHAVAEVQPHVLPLQVQPDLLVQPIPVVEMHEQVLHLLRQARIHAQVEVVHRQQLVVAEVQRRVVVALPVLSVPVVVVLPA